MSQVAFETPEKLGLFGKIGRFFKGIFNRRPVDESEFQAYSKFKQFYDTMSRKDPQYVSVRQAATLCDDALRVAKQRMRVSTRLHELDGKLSELESFINLSDDEITDLKRMLDRFIALTKERSVLLEKLTGYDNSLVEMTTLEEEALAAVPLIKDAEKHQRALRQDMGYLMGEKEELIHERGDMTQSLSFIRRFTTGMVGIFAIVTLVLIFLHVSGRAIFLPTSILVLLVMAIISLLHFFRQRLKREMRRNIRKQHRAIELLNKKSVVYAYYTNYLRFCYNKYHANNSRTLESNLSDLEGYKFVANRIDTVRSLMYETEESIERFIRQKKLAGVKATIEGFAKTVNLDDKKRLFKELKSEKNIVERELAELDVRHEEIWESLMELNDNDKSRSNVVSKILETYLSESGKLFTTLDEEEEPAEQKPGWKIFDWLTKESNPTATNNQVPEPTSSNLTPVPVTTTTI